MENRNVLNYYSFYYSTSTDEFFNRLFYPILFIFICTLYILKRVLHLDEMSVAAKVYLGEQDENDASKASTAQVIDKCTTLKAPYQPTWFWGKSGHIQTLLFGMMHTTLSHKKAPPSEVCEQHHVTLQDGSLVSFNVYQAKQPHESGQEITLVCCPGIFGDFKKSYIQSLFGSAVYLGYRCVCLNHLGVTEGVPLKTPRLFTYGSTEEYDAMCQELFRLYPESQFIAIGFSMGANVVCKYLGEKPERQKMFKAAMSICQGYDCLLASKCLQNWNKGQVFYSWVLAQRFISLVHKHPIVMEEARKKGIDLRAVRDSRGLPQFDHTFSYKFYDYPTFEEFAVSQSSSVVLHNIDIPLVLVNARDDPLIGPKYHAIPLKAAEAKQNIAFIETFHGGHLGYFENGLFKPKDVWIDRFVLEFLENFFKSQCC